MGKVGLLFLATALLMFPFSTACADEDAYDDDGICTSDSGFCPTDTYQWSRDQHRQNVDDIENASPHSYRPDDKKSRHHK